MPDWNELFKQEEFRWKDPHAQVVALVPPLKARGARRVLDLGCGAGRHVIFLAHEGFQVCGLDLAETGLAHAQAWLLREGLTAELRRGDIARIPYPDGFFDAVISLYVIYHQRLTGIKQVVAEIDRVLKPGGLALVSLMSRRGYRYGRGEEIEPHTFITDVGDDSGIPHHYSSLAEIETLFAGWAIRQVILEEEPVEGKQVHSHWQVLVEKE